MATKIRHWTLRSKVVLHVVVLGVLSAAILAALYFTTQRNVLQSFIRQEAEIVGSLIENSVFLLKKCGRVQDTQSEIHDLEQLTEAVSSIRILTPEGRIFASTRPAENTTFLPADDRAVLLRMLDGREPRRVFRQRPGSVIQSLSLVENAPACYACHDEQRRINGFLEVDFDYREASALLWRSQWKGIVLGLIALALLTYIILRLFQRLINRPIRQLKEGMIKVQGGDLSVRWAPRKHDEIGSLMDSFNAMVENLQKANAEIEELYRQRLEKAEHLAAFGELAAGLAHEVKNPLSGMKGALEVIEKEAPAGDPAQGDLRRDPGPDRQDHRRHPGLPPLRPAQAADLPARPSQPVRRERHPPGPDPDPGQGDRLPFSRRSGRRPRFPGRGPPAGSDPQSSPEQHRRHP